MSAAELRAEEYSRHESEVAGWPVGVTTWRRGDTWICHVDNVSPGAVIARSMGPSKDAAIAAALARVHPRLAATRRHPL